MSSQQRGQLAVGRGAAVWMPRLIFRIFNPMTQVDKFDKDHKYIKEYVPEFGTDDYPEKW